MTRAAAVARAHATFDDGSFVATLARRVALASESQVPARAPVLRAYLEHEMAPAFAALGFVTRVVANPLGEGPFLIAERIEDPGLPTVLGYGHGDVIRGQEGAWREGLAPWRLVVEGDRIYGRGTADNKGQHSVNMAALAAVLATRGRLGFNARFLIETGEEVGSPGLREVCRQEGLSADALIASDGPRLAAATPTVFLGARGCLNFTLSVDLREGAHHSGNWGGALANPAIILAHALAAITGPRGRITVPGWLPGAIPEGVRLALADLAIGGGDDAPAIDPGWGEPGLTTAEKVFAWTTFEVLAMTAGTPAAPVNAIPPRARAHCQIRFVPGVALSEFVPALRRHLDACGFPEVAISTDDDIPFDATRLDPAHPWARWAVASIARTTGKRVAILPSLGGSLPNDIFAHDLGLATVWVPHSYPGCCQHAPNEHALASILREALGLMAGLYWDLGEAPPA